MVWYFDAIQRFIGMRGFSCKWFTQTRSFQALVSVVEDDRLAQSRQSELVRREKEATQAVKKLEADLFAERADHARQVSDVSASSRMRGRMICLGIRCA